MFHIRSQVDDFEATLIMDIYRLLFLMVLSYAHGTHHIWCMIVVDDYHGLFGVFGLDYECIIYHLM